MLKSLFFIIIFLSDGSLFAGVKTCQELSAKIVGRKYIHSEKDTEIKWPSSLSQANEIKELLKNELIPLYVDATTGQFKGTDGALLPYTHFKVPNEKGAIVIIHGVTESRPIWLEQIRTWVKEGYSIFIYDQRGHGNATTEVENPHKIHVEKFNQYVDDMNIFINKIVKKDEHARLYLIGNSMGGLISSLYLANHPDVFDAGSVVVPAFQIKTPYPKFVVRALVNTLNFAGYSKSYAISQGDRDLTEAPKHTHSLERWGLLPEIQKHFPFVTLKGGKTNQWVSAILDANHDFEKTHSKIKTPLLVINAGKDSIVKQNRVKEYATNDKNATYYEEPESYHAILNERDDIRNPMLTEMIRYFVNPERLDSKPREDELRRLFDSAERYLERKEDAFAKYSIDEAYRVLRWKGNVFADWNASKTIEKLEELKLKTHETLKASTLEQKGLYRFLAYQRKQELIKLYGSTEPK